MSEKRKDLIAAFVSALAIAVFVFFNSAELEQSLLHRLSDSCFAGGGLILGIAGLTFCANKGVFYNLGYAGSQIMGSFRGEKSRSYYDYCAEQQAKDKKPVIHLVIAGGAFLVLSFVFLLLRELTA